MATRIIPVRSGKAGTQFLAYLKFHLSNAALARTIAAVLSLLLICIPFTIAAIGAFPIYDDGWFWLLLREHGASSVVPALRDRPVWAALLALLAPSEPVLWIVNFAAQALLWPALGILTALLWRHLFPHYRRFAFVVGCVSIAPFITQVQLLTVQFASGPLLSVVLAYTGVLLLLRFVASADRRGKIALAASLPVLAASVILTEYALPVVLVAAVLFVWRLWLARDAAETRRYWNALTVLLLLTGAAYTAFLLLTNSSDRPDVHPFYIFMLGKSLLGTPFRVGASLWYGAVGGLMASMNHLSVMSLLGLLGAGYGVLIAVLLIYSCGEGRALPGAAPRVLQRELLPLAVAVVAGLVPVAMTGRTWSGGMESRFGVPVLPLLAAVLVLGSLVLVRPRFWAVPVLLFGFVAGNVAFTESWTAINERKMMISVGQTLQTLVPKDGQYTVAVLALPERALGWQRPWELTARLAADWTPQQREHFWAYSASDKRVLNSFGNRWSCKYPLKIRARIQMGPTLDRFVKREGPVSRLLWVEPQPDGSVVVDEYCQDVLINPNSIIAPQALIRR